MSKIPPKIVERWRKAALEPPRPPVPSPRLIQPAELVEISDWHARAAAEFGRRVFAGETHLNNDFRWHGKVSDQLLRLAFALEPFQ